MQFRRFCYEQNRTVRIGLGAESREVSLFPDVCQLMEWLPDKVAALKRGQPTTLDFPERQMAIQFAPHGKEAVITVDKFGSHPTINIWNVDLESTLQMLEGFIRELMGLAVASGYLTPEQVQHLVTSAA